MLALPLALALAPVNPAAAAASDPVDAFAGAPAAAASPDPINTPAHAPAAASPDPMNTPASAPESATAPAPVDPPARVPASADGAPPPAPTASLPATAPAAPADPSPARPRWWGPYPRPKVSGYGAPALRLSGLHGAFAAFVGLEGGINIVQRLTLGASLLWLLNPVDAKPFAVGTATRLNFNYGGLVVDVAYVRGKRLAGTIGGLVGGGGACVQDPNNGDCADRIGFFVGEPRTGLRVILAPIVRLHLAFGWRLVAARAWDGPRALGGPSGTLTLEFGLF